MTGPREDMAPRAVTPSRAAAPTATQTPASGKSPATPRVANGDEACASAATAAAPEMTARTALLTCAPSRDGGGVGRATASDIGFPSWLRELYCHGAKGSPREKNAPAQRRRRWGAVVDFISK